MNLNEITKEALVEAVSIARHLGFSGQEGKRESLAQNLQIGQTAFKTNSSPKQSPFLCSPIDGWCWGP